jgi:hypothetical protein
MMGYSTIKAKNCKITDEPRDPRPGLGGRCRSVLSHVCFAGDVSDKKMKHM